MPDVRRTRRSYLRSLPHRRPSPIIYRMDYQGRIVIDPEIQFGKPCVRGTRITVGDVLSYLASGMREDQILADFPQLTREDIRACLAFAAERGSAAGPRASESRPLRTEDRECVP